MVKDILTVPRSAEVIGKGRLLEGSLNFTTFSSIAAYPSRTRKDFRMEKSESVIASEDLSESASTRARREDWSRR